MIPLLLQLLELVISLAKLLVALFKLLVVVVKLRIVSIECLSVHLVCRLESCSQFGFFVSILLSLRIEFLLKFIDLPLQVFLALQVLR
jgi:hypothetical protein